MDGWKEPYSEWDAAMTSMTVIFEWLGNHSDQQAWALYYILLDDGIITAGDIPTENQMKLALDKYENV